MPNPVSSFLDRFMSGAQGTGEAAIRAKDLRRQESDRQGLEALNQDVVQLVQRAGRPLKSDEWTYALRKHKRTLADAEPFLRAGLFQKAESGREREMETLDEELKRLRLREGRSRLDKLLNPEPETHTNMIGSADTGYDLVSWGDDPGKATTTRVRDPRAKAGSEGQKPLQEWTDTELLSALQKASPTQQKLDENFGKTQRVVSTFDPGMEDFYNKLQAELFRRMFYGASSPLEGEGGPASPATPAPGRRRMRYNPADGSLR